MKMLCQKNAIERRGLGSELDDNHAERRAFWSRDDFRLSGHRLYLSTTTTLWYTNFKVYHCTAVTTVVPRSTL